MAPRASADVVEVLSGYPADVRDALFALRALIYDEAAATGGTGLVETLTWGQPAYRTKRGSPIRIGREKKTDGDYALFFKCRTSLVGVFRERFGGVLRVEGNRAIVFRLGEPFPEAEVRKCIRLALTYYDWKGGPPP